MTLICEQCKGDFERRSTRGPVPRVCSDACRQALHRSRVRETRFRTRQAGARWLRTERITLHGDWGDLR